MLSGKKIVVTGASSGIGQATAVELMRRGAEVIAVDRHAPQGTLALNFHPVDLSSPSEIDGLVERLPSGIDGLANIAGLPPTRSPQDILKVNLLGLCRLTRALLPKMANEASVVNLASLAGFRWRQNLPAIKAVQNIDFAEAGDFCTARALDGVQSYCLSKEALIVWTMQNRWTWLDRGIRMNCVSPGPVDTPILKDFVASFGDKVNKSIRQSARAGTALDIAPVVAFLLSDASAWLRGSNVAADGGAYADLLCSAEGI